jgi:AraC-like DNA-binding protein
MISHVLPDINTFCATRPQLRDNAVIWATTAKPYFYPEHKTPYLFVANFINNGMYVLNRRPVEACHRWFYFLNAHDELEIRFSTALPLQTLFILFSDSFIQECVGYFNSTPETLIDGPGLSWRHEITFPNVPFELNQHIGQVIAALQQKNLPQEAIDDLLFRMLSAFLPLVADTKKKMHGISAIKKTTKEELYRRLFLARELMNDLVFENLSLDQMAQQVCLNKFHFLTCFREVYKTTPHRYFRELKLQKAFHLLSDNHHTVTTVCHLLGFESVGSFSNLFTKRFGISPSAVADR